MKICCVLFAIVMTAPSVAAVGASPHLGANDVTWLWPAPQANESLERTIGIASLLDFDGQAVWSDEQFADILKAADSASAAVGPNHIQLPPEVRTKEVWRIAAFRVDPTAPGSHEVVRKNFGEKPQIRLVLQPVVVDGDKITVHDIAIHPVYSFMLGPEGESGERPDRERFKTIVADLDALKAFVNAANVDTSKPLGVHPGLDGNVPELTTKAREFLSKHLSASRVDAMALMGLDGPEPWIFIALAKLPPTPDHFTRVPFLPAQMLSFRGSGEVLPPPRVNNLNPIPSGTMMPADEKDRRGVSTATLFNESELDLSAPAMVGRDELGQAVFDETLKNSDIPDLIAHPERAHFFNTDCLSCHTETRRRLRFDLKPSVFAYRVDDRIASIDHDVLPKHDWNVRNLGWFPPHRAIGGGPVSATITQRTANETAEVVAYIEKEYRDSDSSGGNQERLTPSRNEISYFDQGWTEEERLDFYFSRQGSQLVPYSWFLNLEVAAGEELLRSPAHMRKLGFIPHEVVPGRNPDGLPIGFVLDSSQQDPDTKAGFLGPDFDRERYPTDDWLGLTCAACHTSELAHNGRTYRVDGGAALSDVETFLSELAQSLRATATDDEKFRRFEAAIKERAEGDVDTTGLRSELEAYTPVIERLVARNKADEPYGLGRLDAFGAILNQICAAGLNIPANNRKSNAPVSYPFLWDTPMLDWVQWNSSVEIPISRNVGEVLGVFAHAKLTGTPDTGQFISSARLQLLHRLEKQLQILRAPRWQQEFGEIDVVKAAAGRELFSNNCAQCHNMRDDNGNFAMTEPNSLGRTFIKTKAVPFNEIGTDPQMVRNFVERTALPGDLASMLNLDSPSVQAKLKAYQDGVESLGLPRPNLEGAVPAAMLLNASVVGVIDRDLASQLRNRTPAEQLEIRQDLEGFREGDPPPLMGAGYKARPLNGIWATAPYGHAGAVPNLYQWLLPEDRRQAEFFVGNREFDPIHVGYDTAPVEGAFKFRVRGADGKPIPGNSNLGHSAPEQTDFSDEERWQIIEYLKTQ